MIIESAESEIYFALEVEEILDPNTEVLEQIEWGLNDSDYEASSVMAIKVVKIIEPLRCTCDDGHDWLRSPLASAYQYGVSGDPILIINDGTNAPFILGDDTCAIKIRDYERKSFLGLK